jgi:hypothetical protein
MAGLPFETRIIERDTLRESSKFLACVAASGASSIFVFQKISGLAFEWMRHESVIP